MIERENLRTTRRGLVRAVLAGAADAVLGSIPQEIKADLGLPFGDRVTVRESEKFVLPEWIIQKFSHHRLEENGPHLIKTAEAFRLDPRLLLAMLLTETPGPGYKDEGPMQITDIAYEEILKKVAGSQKLGKTMKELGLANLRNRRDHRQAFFMTCVHLDTWDFTDPPLSEERKALSEMKMAAMKYNSGPHVNLYGQRVEEIILLLRHPEKEISRDLKYLWGIYYEDTSQRILPIS